MSIFDHCFGRLPYRSIRFEPETLQQEYFQPTMQVNYPNDHDFTRIVEIKHARGQKLPSTTIVREYPQNFGPGHEPYYPIPASDAKALYCKYAERAALEKTSALSADSPPTAITTWIRLSAWLRQNLIACESPGKIRSQRLNFGCLTSLGIIVRPRTSDLCHLKTIVSVDVVGSRFGDECWCASDTSCLNSDTGL
jgi:hypothetical protein